jgi:FixJ family two-component response regulator
MISKTKPQIVIIDDDITPDNYPLVDVLGIEYGEENIHIFETTKKGIQFIEDNLSKRIIVLLDIMFGGKPMGFDVFDKFTKKSSLVCFIVMSGNMEFIDRKDFIKLINGHAWYFIQRDKSYQDIIDAVKKAERHLIARVDGALEEFISQLDELERNRPIYASRKGQKWTFDDVLREIREQTDEGTRLEKNIIKLTLDLIAQGKRPIDA